MSLGPVVACGLAAIALLFSRPAAAAPDPALLAYASADHSVRLADGRTLHLTCMGQGSPTVILTAGLGDWGVVWSRVQPAIAKTTRVCAWDRPGFGLSSPSRAPQTVVNTTKDLQEALTRGGLKGPYVLVGHSLGAYETMRLADLTPGAVAGLVLVDPSIPDQSAIVAREAPNLTNAIQAYYSDVVAQLRRCAASVRDGSLAFGKPDKDECLSQPANYPAALTAKLTAMATDPALFETQGSLVANIEASSALMVTPGRTYGDKPLVVLTALKPPEFPPGTPQAAIQDAPKSQAAFARGRDQIAALSTRGVNKGVEGASHYIQIDRPDAVIEAIQSVVAQVRTGGR